MKSKVTVGWLLEHYSKREVMVPMRDGVSLFTALYEPRDGKEHPVILERTPYPLHPYGKTYARDLRARLDAFVAAGYIIVFQNVRGTFLSKGTFENIRPYRPEKSGTETDEASDAYDTAEWLVRNCRTNGSIGVKGISYPGFYATLAALSGHPAIKAVSPQAPVTDWFLGDDAHLSGAFQYAMFTFGASFFRPRPRPTIRWPRPVARPEGAYYDWFLKTGRRGVTELLQGQVTFWDEMRSHPAYDAWWEARNPALQLKNVRPAVMVVGGWYDGEDCYGAFETYRRLKAQSPQTDTYLVAGPWYHGAWKKKGYAELGPADFGAGSAEHFLYDIEYPFFACYLEGKGDPGPRIRILPSAETQPGQATPHRWETPETWPPAGRDMTLYLSDSRRLSSKPGTQSFRFISDPRHPVPSHPEPAEDWDRAVHVADQRFAARRPDVLAFTSRPLREPVNVEGQVRVRLEVMTEAEDADLFVKLIDRRPDGVQMLVRCGVLPLRFRNGFDRPQPVRKGEKVVLEWSLNDLAHHFQPGHRIMVQIQGSWFPQVAMNPQRFLEDPSLAGSEDMAPAAVTLLPGSRIILPVTADWNGI